MITHNLDYLKYVDYIYVMERGQIVDQGSYDQIKTHDIYAHLLEKYHSTSAQEEEKKSKDEIEEIDQIETEELKETRLIKVKSQDKSHEKDNDNKEICDASESGDKTADIPPNSILEKLIMAEDRQTGNIGFSVYNTFLNYYGGFRFAALIFICKILSFALCTHFFSNQVMLPWIGFSLGVNFYISHWTNANKRNQDNDDGNQFVYLANYALLGIAFTLTCGVISIVIIARSLACSKKLHHLMLKSIMRAPINLFFDRVPIGRILNRFSKDLDTADKALPFSFYFFLGDFYLFWGGLAVCLYGSSFYLFPLAIFFMSISLRLQRRYQTLNRELVRLGNSNFVICLSCFIFIDREHIKEPDSQSLQRINQWFNNDSRL